MLSNRFLGPLFTLCTLLVSVRATPGYAIDDSCDPVSTQINKLIDDARVRIDNAIKALSKPQRNTDVQTVFNLLFPAGTEATVIAVYQGMLDQLSNKLATPPQKAPAGTVVAPDGSGIMQAAPLQDPLYRDQELSIFYCNMDRFEGVRVYNDPTYGDVIWDPTTRYIIIYGPNPPSTNLPTDPNNNAQQKKGWDDCNNAELANSMDPEQKYVMAQTMTRPGYASQIDLCVWYVEKTMKREFDDSIVWDIKKPFIELGHWLQHTLIKKNTVAEIDKYNLAVATIIHEMAHTYHASLGIGLNPQNNAFQKIDDSIGYGWLTVAATKSIKNADHYNNFAIALEKMMNANSPQMPNRQGKLVSVTLVVVKRLLRMWRWSV